MKNIKEAFKRSVQRLSASSDDQFSYLKKDINIDPIELLLEYDEVYIIVVNQKPDSLSGFSRYELDLIEDFNNFLKGLPPESDEFWSYEGLMKWGDLRNRAAKLLSQLR